MSKADLSPEADLMLHVMYERQHRAGRESLSEAEIIMHVSDELFEHGTPEAAIAAIRKRVGLPGARR